MSEALTWPSVLAWRVARQGLAQRVEQEQWPALVRRFGDEVAAVSVDGQKAWMLAADVAAAPAAEPSGAICLLPAFDQYVVAAAREPSQVLDAGLKERVYRAQGWLSPVLLVDGRIEGVWRQS